MSNELKLSIENFQSISQGELVFHTGTTVIVGQSNSGKSATFRALKACLSNPSGSQRFIKKGTKQASVILEYNGNQIVWKKSEKENSYIINGEEYIKTGTSDAFKLVEDTGFTTDCNDVIMNIEEELQLPFPFGNTKSELFKLFENVFCISDSAVILKSAKEHEDKAKADLVMLKNEHGKNLQKLEELKAFKEELNLDKMKNMKSSLQTKSNRINLLKDGLPAIKQSIQLQKVGVIQDNLDLSNKFSEYQSICILKKEALKLKELHKVDKVKLPSIEIKDHIETYKTLKVLRSVSDIKVIEKEFEDKLQKYRDLCSLRTYLENIKSTIKQKREQINVENDKVDSAQKLLSEFKVCPLCHQSLEH